MTPSTAFDRSLDGAIRLTRQQLFDTPIRIHDAALVNDHETQKTDTITELAGYVEWVSDTQPALSIGWDWSIVHGQYTLQGEPYVNFIIQSQDGKDFDSVACITNVTEFISQQKWRNALIQFLNDSH